MPNLWTREISVLLDAAGCPNRCRHCWLGCPPNGRMSEETIRRVARLFREWVRPGETKPFAAPLEVMTWYREPDFAPDYREMYELEKELNGGKAARFELLSIWRLARDEDYAQWARDVGTEVCQISLFGMEETTDWFVRRRGAFREGLIATERLLAVGIRPRWQLFLTTRIVPELDDLLRLTQDMEIEKRVRDLGGEFQIFLHAPGPDGEGWNIEHLRPEVDVIAEIPKYLVDKTVAHFAASSVEDAFGRAERDLLAQLRDDPKPFAWKPDKLAFMVTPDLDVFSNIAEPMPWWRLGNLDTDGMDAIMRRFEQDDTPGMQAMFHAPMRALAERYGRKDSGKIYKIVDLKGRLVRQWAQEEERQNHATDHT